MSDMLPIYVAFSTNDTYIPYLDVCLRSLIDYVDKEKDYHVFILYSTIIAENIQKIKELEQKNISISFKNNHFPSNYCPNPYLRTALLMMF